MVRTIQRQPQVDLSKNRPAVNFRNAPAPFQSTLLSDAPKLRPPDALTWSVPGPYEGAVSGDPYDNQPAELRRVVDKPFWESLDRADKETVTSLYNRFARLGLWGYAQRVRKVKKGAPPWCGVWVEGDTPSVYFEGDAKGLSKALIWGHQFCLDPWYGALMHKGQASFRELSESDGLHVSIGPLSGLFDAHIDRHAPVRHRDGNYCVYDPAASAQHHLSEAALSPGAFRGYIKLPVRPELFQTLHSQPGVRPDLPELFEQNEQLTAFARPVYGASSLKGMGKDLIRIGIGGRFSMGFLEGEQPRKRKPREPAVESLDLQLLDLSRGGR